jgi:hypothetical protein
VQLVVGDQPAHNVRHVFRAAGVLVPAAAGCGPNTGRPAIPRCMHDKATRIGATVSIIALIIIAHHRVDRHGLMLLRRVRHARQPFGPAQKPQRTDKNLDALQRKQDNSS